MNRLTLFLLLSWFPAAGMAQDKFATVAVTGTIQLPAGAVLPAKARIDVEIGKIEPGQVLTIIRTIGKQEISKVTGTPVQFRVLCPRTHLKDAKPESFTLRATVYDLGQSKRKKVFETPTKEALQPFTANLQPKPNVILPVKAVPSR